MAEEHRDAAGNDRLDDFEQTTFTHDGKTRTIYRQGTGPAVIVMAEIPGITPLVADFARRVVDLGCTAVLPHLFGTPGRSPTAGDRMRVGYALSSIGPACVSREFRALATRTTEPVSEWLRALGRSEFERCCDVSRRPLGRVVGGG